MKTERRPFRRECVDEIYARDGYTCYYCGSTDNLSLDHVIPLSRGGSNKKENLITSCRSCNSQKNGNRLPKKFERIVLEYISNANDLCGIDGTRDAISAKRCTKLPNKRSVEGRRFDREKDYISRILSVSGDLSVIVVANTDLVRLRVAAKRRGHEILAIPDGDRRKIVFVDGCFDHKGEFGALRPVSNQEAVSLIVNRTPIAGKASGNLGK